MNTSIFLGLILGTIIGGTFAWLQLLSARRNEMQERRQEVPSRLRQIPSSAGRCAFLLISLVLVQMLFPSANLTCLAIGIVVAYAIPFGFRLRVKYLHR